MKLSDIDNPRVRAEIARLLEPPKATALNVSAGEIGEDSLHDEISDYCKSRGWLAFHGSMAHRTRRTLGEPDFIVARSDGATLFVEVKTRTGKLSPEQQAIGHALTALNQRWAVVRSFEEFIEFSNRA